MFNITSFSRSFRIFAVLPLLFIAGFQLFVLSEKTDYYFAWTIALPLTAAFMGAGYWAALVSGYLSLRQPASLSLRIVGLPSIAATGLLGIATFLHLDRFHLNSPALLTRFVTWVWIVVYIVTPFIFLWLWTKYRLGPDETMGAQPFPTWVRFGYLFQAVLTLLAGILLFFAPASIIPFWPWVLTPLTARAVGAWLTAYGLACATVNRENNTSNTAGTDTTLFAFCIFQLIVLARYFSSFDLTKPLAWIYLLILLVGVSIGVSGLLTERSK